MPALHGWHGEDRSDRWDENGDILDDEDGNDDQHDLEIASWYTWTEHDCWYLYFDKYGNFWTSKI